MKRKQFFFCFFIKCKQRSGYIFDRWQVSQSCDSYSSIPARSSCKIASLETEVIPSTNTFLRSTWGSFEKQWVKESSRSFLIETSHETMVLHDTFLPNVWQKFYVSMVDVFVHVSIKVCLPKKSTAIVLKSRVYLSMNKLCPHKHYQNNRRCTEVAMSASIVARISCSEGREGTLDLKCPQFQATNEPPRVVTKNVSHRMAMIARWANGLLLW